MNFYSNEFFLFFLITAGLFFRLPGKYQWIVLLAASFYFYGSFGFQFLPFILVSTVIGYFSCIKIGTEESQQRRKRYLLLNILANCAILLFFKYANFFGTTLNDVAHFFGWTVTVPHLNLFLPLGISFYTFSIISSSIDIYRHQTEPERHLGKYALFVAFFPRVLAGPIERARQFLPQLSATQSFDWARITFGLKLVVWGFFKKIVIADRLALFVDPVFANPSGYDGLSLTMASLFYTCQLYADFSGYTDIAIGCSHILGFTIADNFNRPYGATSVGDFWRRWHMSFSFWLRDYLYIPLGGNRTSKARYYFNILIVFFVCGLWHGANWTFVIWGLLHGIYLCISRLSEKTRGSAAERFGLTRFPALHRRLKVLITYLLVAFAWIFFRAASVSDAWYVVSHLHRDWPALTDIQALSSSLFLGRPTIDLFLALGAIGFFYLFHRINDHATIRTMFAGRPPWLRWSFYYILVLSILLIGVYGSDKFIYFQF